MHRDVPPAATAVGLRSLPREDGDAGMGMWEWG